MVQVRSNAIVIIFVVHVPALSKMQKKKIWKTEIYHRQWMQKVSKQFLLNLWAFKSPSEYKSFLLVTVSIFPLSFTFFFFLFHSFKKHYFDCMVFPTCVSRLLIYLKYVYSCSNQQQFEHLNSNTIDWNVLIDFHDFWIR